MRRTEKNTTGFSLVEMLITVGIVLVITSLSVVNFRSGENARELRRESLKILSGLQQVQSMSLTGDLVYGQVPSYYNFTVGNCNPGDAPCGYMIWASSTDGKFLPIANVSTTKNIQISLKNAKNSELTVAFKTGRGNVLICGLNADASEAIIETGFGSLKYCLKVNEISGRLDLQKDACN